ncbi:MAG: hypothetical protein ABFR62_01840 [Bacteroidota bacterium]
MKRILLLVSIFALCATSTTYAQDSGNVKEENLPSSQADVIKEKSISYSYVYIFDTSNKNDVKLEEAKEGEFILKIYQNDYVSIPGVEEKQLVYNIGGVFISENERYTLQINGTGAAIADTKDLKLYLYSTEEIKDYSK